MFASGQYFLLSTTQSLRGRVVISFWSAADGSWIPRLVSCICNINQKPRSLHIFFIDLRRETVKAALGYQNDTWLQFNEVALGLTIYFPIACSCCMNDRVSAPERFTRREYKGFFHV